MGCVDTVIENDSVRVGYTGIPDGRCHIPVDWFGNGIAIANGRIVHSLSSRTVDD